MQYLTMTLGLIESDYPMLHTRLKSRRTLLQSAQDYASSLKRCHADWMDRLSIRHPETEDAQIAS
jgi:hypothetical protein